MNDGTPMMDALRSRVHLKQKSLLLTVDSEVRSEYAKAQHDGRGQYGLGIAGVSEPYFLVLNETASAWTSTIREMVDRGALNTLPLPRADLSLAIRKSLLELSDVLERKAERFYNRIPMGGPLASGIVTGLRTKATELAEEIDSELAIIEQSLINSSPPAVPTSVAPASATQEAPARHEPAEPDRFARIVSRARNHPVLVIIFVVILIIGIAAKFSEDLRTLGGFVGCGTPETAETLPD